nr:uncharacterized protein LOC133589617 isoform X2 [Nerophis lumbriciformis]
MAAADEAFGLFERTTVSYDDEVSRTKEKERHQLEAVSKTQIGLHVQDVQQLIGRQEERSTVTQQHPQPPHIKAEEEELRITREGGCLLGPEETDLTKLQLNVVSVKTEDDGDKPTESFQLHHSPNVHKLIGHQEVSSLQPQG